MIDIIGGTEWHAGIGAVHRGGRSVEEVPAFRAPAAFKNVEEACEIGIGIGMRIDQRVTHAGLRGEMHDSGKAMRREQVGDRPAIGDVQLHELEIGEALEFRDSTLFQPRVVMGIEIVEAQHVMSVRQQAARDMHSDEPGGPSDQDRILQDGSLSSADAAQPFATPRRRRAARRQEILSPKRGPKISLWSLPPEGADQYLVETSGEAAQQNYMPMYGGRSSSACAGSQFGRKPITPMEAGTAIATANRMIHML